MDLVRANSRSPSCLGGAVDSCVECRDSSELVELNDDGDRDISSFGSTEPFGSFMVVGDDVAWLQETLSFCLQFSNRVMILPWMS